jgi:ribosomal-protein-alanine N-acetyltransferase
MGESLSFQNVDLPNILFTMLLLNFKPFPVLSTERLNLRRIIDEDIEEIFFLRSDIQMLQFLDRDPAKSIEEVIQWIQMINEAIDNDQYIAWAITLKNETKLIGTITFWNIKKEHYRAEIGYALHMNYQGAGLMQEAIRAVIISLTPAFLRVRKTFQTKPYFW